MKSVVMEFCILDNKKKMPLTVYIFPMKLFSNLMQIPRKSIYNERNNCMVKCENRMEYCSIECHPSILSLRLVVIDLMYKLTWDLFLSH